MYQKYISKLETKTEWEISTFSGYIHEDLNITYKYLWVSTPTGVDNVTATTHVFEDFKIVKYYFQGSHGRTNGWPSCAPVLQGEG